MGLFDKLKTTTRVETKVIDASDNPELHKEILDVLEAAGVDAGMGTIEEGTTVYTSSGGGEDIVSQLERLAALRESGALTEADFQAAKAKVLGG